MTPREAAPNELHARRILANPGATGGRARSAEDLQDLGETRHVVDWNLDRDVERLAAACIDDLDRPRFPSAAATRRLASAQEPPDLLERPLRRRKPDALQRAARRAQD